MSAGEGGFGQFLCHLPFITGLSYSFVKNARALLCHDRCSGEREGILWVRCSRDIMFLHVCLALQAFGKINQFIPLTFKFSYPETLPLPDNCFMFHPNLNDLDSASHKHPLQNNY